MFTQLISDARAAEWEHIGPEDDDRLFYKMAWWKKVIVMAGGPTVNILIAFFIFWPSSPPTATPSRRRDPPAVAAVSACVVPAREERARVHRRGAGGDPTPANEAGLQPGDRFVSASTASRSPLGPAAELVRGNGDGEAVIDLRARRQRADRHRRHHVEVRPTSSTDPEAHARSASSA